MSETFGRIQTGKVQKHFEIELDYILWKCKFFATDQRFSHLKPAPPNAPNPAGVVVEYWIRRTSMANQLENDLNADGEWDGVGLSLKAIQES